MTKKKVISEDKVKIWCPVNGAHEVPAPRAKKLLDNPNSGWSEYTGQDKAKKAKTNAAGTKSNKRTTKAADEE